MLRVLGRLTSINVRKVTWALDEMGVEFGREDWGKPVRDPNVPEFLALNPNGQVPVLIDEGFVLWESTAILRYLAGKYDSDLWPRDLRERAVVDQWMTWQGTELNQSWGYIVPALLRGTPPNPDPERLGAAGRAWAAKMRIIDDHLAESGGFVANGRFSLADIVIALSTHRWMSVPFDKPVMPAAERHLLEMQTRPAGKSVLGAGTP